MAILGLPTELLELILEILAVSGVKGHRTLLSCTLVNRRLGALGRTRLFTAIYLRTAVRTAAFLRLVEVSHDLGASVRMVVFDDPNDTAFRHQNASPEELVAGRVAYDGWHPDRWQWYHFPKLEELFALMPKVREILFERVDERLLDHPSFPLLQSFCAPVTALSLYTINMESPSSVLRFISSFPLVEDLGISYLSCTREEPELWERVCEDTPRLDLHALMVHRPDTQRLYTDPNKFIVSMCRAHTLRSLSCWWAQSDEPTLSGMLAETQHESLEDMIIYVYNHDLSPSIVQDLILTTGLPQYIALKSLAIKVEFAHTLSPSLSWTLPFVRALPFLPVLEELVFEDEQLHALGNTWMQADLPEIARGLARFPMLAQLHIGYRFGEAELDVVERHLLLCARDAGLGAVHHSSATRVLYPELAGPMGLVSLFAILDASAPVDLEGLDIKDAVRTEVGHGARRLVLAICARVNDEDDKRLFDAMKILV